MKQKVAFEKSVGAVIFRKEGENILYLLLHYQSGHWEYAKGHIEEGENPLDTLRREAREEAGLADLKILPNFKKSIRFFYKATGSEEEKRKELGKGTLIIKRVDFYLAETQIKDIKLSFEHTGYEWLPYKEALKKITYKNSKDVLKEANEFLINNKQQGLNILYT